MHDELDGLSCVRVGRWRVVYRYSKRMVTVVAVGPRSTIYSDLARVARRKRDRRGLAVAFGAREVAHG
ncbi:MAG: hypothetical protein A3H36_01395 [Chloroflexi bacterium RIFCSPLOWO2_02_FULL_71_16]|nr:MAG: hypothetical protein A3H36_01395 [Chloroflexi bacterium RIFCSPLOWO2_02_FULL_71_16]